MMPAEKVLPEIIELLMARPRLSWIHANRAQGTGGFPDLVIAGPRGVIFREVKPTRFDHLRPHQTTWRYRLVASGADFAVWSQEGLDDGSIERQLDALD
jgi:hypothetical protein